MGTCPRASTMSTSRAAYNGATIVLVRGLRLSAML
jgi:hypothetical protein